MPGDQYLPCGKAHMNSDWIENVILLPCFTISTWVASLGCLEVFLMWELSSFYRESLFFPQWILKYKFNSTGHKRHDLIGLVIFLVMLSLGKVCAAWHAGMDWILGKLVLPSPAYFWYEVMCAGSMARPYTGFVVNYTQLSIIQGLKCSLGTIHFSCNGVPNPQLLYRWFMKTKRQIKQILTTLKLKECDDMVKWASLCLWVAVNFMVPSADSSFDFLSLLASHLIVSGESWM